MPLPGTAWAHWTAPIAPTAALTARDVPARQRLARAVRLCLPPGGGDRDQRRRDGDSEGAERDVQLPGQILRSFVPGSRRQRVLRNRVQRQHEERERAEKDEGRPKEHDGLQGTGYFDGDPLWRAEAGDGSGLTLVGGQLHEVVARLGDDPRCAAAGHSVERELRSQVEEVALDHATTVFIVSENCFHCPLSFASSVRPRLVRRYIRRRRPAATVHSLASSPPDSSR